mgnify:CR=1 FL=1
MLADFDEAEEFIDIFRDIDRDEIKSQVSEDVDFEKLVSAMSDISQEISFLKDLKKSRVSPITAKINKLERNEAELREIAVELMDSLFPNKKTVDFPGVGKVTKRQTKGKWEITDEEELLKFARKHNKYKEMFDRKFTVKKKEMPSILAEILKETEEEPDGAVFVNPEFDFALTVTFHKD